MTKGEAYTGARWHNCGGLREHALDAGRGAPDHHDNEDKGRGAGAAGGGRCRLEGAARFR